MTCILPLELLVHTKLFALIIQICKFQLTNHSNLPTFQETIYTEKKTSCVHWKRKRPSKSKYKRIKTSFEQCEGLSFIDHGTFDRMSTNARR